MISSDTIITGVVCKKCRVTLPPHTIQQHLDETFHKCHPLTEVSVNALEKYQSGFGLDDVERIFPRSVDQVSEQWMACEGNLLKFWDSLNSENKELLVEDIQYQHFYLKK